jgi:AcrR family transcriptional regulator
MKRPHGSHDKTPAPVTRQREFDVPGEQGRTGALSASTVLALAETLIDVGGGSSAIDIKINLFFPSQAKKLRGRATILFQKDQVTVWETAISEPGGTPVARLVHTLVSNPSVSQPADQAAQDTPREKKAMASLRERRDLIAEAACNVIAAKGFAASSIREIADAAGMHVPTMYQYVKSKDEVLELVYSWVIGQVRTNIADALASTESPKDKLMSVTRKFLENNNIERRQTGVLNRELRSLSRGARQRVLGEYAEILKSVAEIIERGSELGQFRRTNPVITANFIDALCDMWALRQFAVGGVSVEEYRENLLSFIQKGLLA